MNEIRIPEDFPSTPAGAVAGAGDKLLLSRQGDRFSDISREWRWRESEEIAQHLAIKARESKDGKRAHMTEQEILAQYIPRLVTTMSWMNEREAKWSMRRAAELLGWPVPAEALD